MVKLNLTDAEALDLYEFLVSFDKDNEWTKSTIVHDMIEQLKHDIIALMQSSTDPPTKHAKRDSRKLFELWAKQQMERMSGGGTCTCTCKGQEKKGKKKSLDGHVGVLSMHDGGFAIVTIDDDEIVQELTNDPNRDVRPQTTFTVHLVVPFSKPISNTETFDVFYCDDIALDISDVTVGRHAQELVITGHLR